MPDDTMTTFRTVNGDPIGDFEWVTDIDYFDGENEPLEVVEEVWQRVSVSQRWVLPTVFYDCDVDWCDEDAVAWVEQAPGDWSQRCGAHRTEVPDAVESE